MNAGIQNEVVGREYAAEMTVMGDTRMPSAIVSQSGGFSGGENPTIAAKPAFLSDAK